jgi:hypothetical protein
VGGLADLPRMRGHTTGTQQLPRAEKQTTNGYGPHPAHATILIKKAAGGYRCTTIKTRSFWKKTVQKCSQKAEWRIFRRERQFTQFFRLTWQLSTALFSSAATGELAQFAQTRRQFAFVGNENGQPLFDRKANSTTGADKLLLIARESGFALRIKRTAELCKEGFVHRVLSPVYGPHPQTP